MNKLISKIRWTLIIAIMAFVYVGCGGGGSGGGPVDPGSGGGGDGGGIIIPGPGGGGGDGGGDGGTGGGDGGTGGGDTTPVTSTTFETLPLTNLDDGSFSAAVAINIDGIAVGYGESDSAVKGVKWNVAAPETASELAPLEGNSYSAAYGINSGGITVGESGVTVDETPDANTVAVFWSAANAITQLPVPVGNAGPYAAYGINDSGLIVGENTLESGNTEAVLWTSAETLSLHQPGWDFSAAYFIHDDGMIIGEAKPADGAVQGVIWMPVGDGFSATLLSPAVGDTSSVAFGIDTSGRIVGETEGAQGVRGIVWTVNAQGTAVEGTEVLDANTSLQAINDDNRMVGYTAASSGSDRASVWNAENIDDSQNIAGAFSQSYGVNLNAQIVGVSGSQAFVSIPQ